MNLLERTSAGTFGFCYAELSLKRSPHSNEFRVFIYFWHCLSFNGGLEHSDLSTDQIFC